MLGKLLKYDLRSVGKSWWISMLTMIFASFSAAVAYRINSEILLHSDASDLYVIIQAVAYLAFLLSVIVMGVCLISVSVMIYIRYFKHLFTDEGYLTFTLPVSRKQIFFSKMINAFVWTVLSYAVLAACLLVFVVISTPTVENGLFAIDTFMSFLKMVLKEFKDRGFWMIVQGVLSILIILANIVLSTGVVYFCITLGSTVVKRGKIFVSFAVYYLLNMAYSTVVQFVSAISIVSFFVGYFNILSQLDFNVIDGAATLMLAVTLAIISTLSALFYCLTLNILERKLNLV